MLREKVAHIDAIILTHEHKDHIAGMDDVRAFNYKTRDAIDIYAEERVLREIRREYSYVFAEQQYPGIPKMRLNEINTEKFSIKGLEIIPVRVMHFRLPILGYRVNDFAYITDANSVPEESKEKLYGVKYLVVNALRKEKHISHFSLYEAIQFIREISPRQAFITHISHQMGLYRDVSKELPPEIRLAFDGLSIEID